ncbi:MAG: peptide-methionine (S)-S-oxide reductase MsrA [Anaerolineales bacterium]|nr:peptide-methionine (S)-S-oxide reductase MsrA [Anaerolineales bacterium]
MTENFETVTLAGGCFWCMEAVYVEAKGVQSVQSGYANGRTPNPTYRQVCGGNTGYAEAVRLTFDPSVISFRDLLDIFFVVHDPTTLNRQGGDVGEQYRSGIYYHTPEQKEIAEATIKELSEQKIWDNPIVTEVEPLKNFYPAEEYHRDYFANNPNQPYCAAVVAPKVAKFRKHFFALWKK